MILSAIILVSNALEDTLIFESGFLDNLPRISKVKLLSINLKTHKIIAIIVLFKRFAVCGC